MNEESENAEAVEQGRPLTRVRSSMALPHAGAHFARRAERSRARTSPRKLAKAGVALEYV